MALSAGTQSRKKKNNNAKFAVYYFCLQVFLHFISIFAYHVLSKMTVLHLHQLKLGTVCA